MRPLRFSTNVTLDGCYDHTVGIPDADLHRNAAENIARADALILGRNTYELRLVDKVEFASGAVAMRYELRR